MNVDMRGNPVSMGLALDAFVYVGVEARADIVHIFHVGVSRPSCSAEDQQSINLSFFKIHRR